MTLREYATFIRRQYLREVALEEARRLLDLSPPMMARFRHMSRDQFERMIQASLESLLAAFEMGRGHEHAMEGVHRLESGAVEGIPKGALDVTDIVLSYTAQKGAILMFLERFTTDPAVVERIKAEVAAHYTKARSEAMDAIIRLRIAHQLGSEKT
jgi:hypothetical protein